jgi:3-phenylpropionate/cinnamic acid dioxygenase small subunit
VTVDRIVLDDIADVLVRYATAIDTRDWPLFRSCFTEDCDADYGDIGHWHGVDEVTEWMRVTHEPCGHTLHRITNVVVSPVDDDRVTARSYVEALVLFGGNQRGVRATGFYDDELVRVDGAWRIARRRFTTALVETVTAASLG